MNVFGIHICMDEVRMVAPFVPPAIVVAVTLRQRCTAALAALFSRSRAVGP